MSHEPSSWATGVQGTVVSAATVATTKYSVGTAFKNQYGDRFAAITVKCNTVYDLEVLGHDDSFASAGGSDASVGKRTFYKSECAATGKDGTVHYVPIAGQRYVLPVLYQHTGGNATVTISYQTFNDFSFMVDADVTIGATVELAAGTATFGVLGANSGVDIGDVTVNNLPFDEDADAMVTIDAAHDHIHAGDAYSCHYNATVSDTNDQICIAFQVPSGDIHPHVVCEVETTGPAYLALYENPDLDVGEGSDLVVWNRDRSSANATAVGSIETPPEYGKATSFSEAQLAGATLSTASELMRVYLGYATSGGSRSGAATRGSQEWALDDGRSYAWVLTSLTNDDNVLNITLDWYDHDDS